jgi:hypothetical protein
MVVLWRVLIFTEVVVEVWNCDILQQYLFQQMHNLIFIYDKLGLRVSAYQAIIRAPITKNTENTASQNK